MTYWLRSVVIIKLEKHAGSRGKGENGGQRLLSEWPENDPKEQWFLNPSAHIYTQSYPFHPAPFFLLALVSLDEYTLNTYSYV